MAECERAGQEGAAKMSLLFPRSILVLFLPRSLFCPSLTVSQATSRSIIMALFHKLFWQRIRTEIAKCKQEKKDRRVSFLSAKKSWRPPTFVHSLYLISEDDNIA